ncbi:MAG: midcut-by-XrtH protein [Burkholderiaceae bacterium]|jgi:hypothetical protein|nr:midcut-by-XrtH protein [Burkholderiaceae bacterium]
MRNVHESMHQNVASQRYAPTLQAYWPRALRIGVPGTVMSFYGVSALGQTITTAPASTVTATPVPVDGLWVLALLVSLLAVTGIWVIRSRSVQRGLLLWGIAACVLAVGGYNTSVRAALAPWLLSFTQPGGQTLSIPVLASPPTGTPTDFTPVQFRNDSGVALRIASITGPSSYAACFPGSIPASPPVTPLPSGATECTEGLRLANGANCVVDIAAMCAHALAETKLATLTVTPASVALVVGAAPTMLTIANASAHAAENLAVQLPAQAPLNIQGNTCGQTLAAGATCTLTLTATDAIALATQVAIRGSNTQAVQVSVTARRNQIPSASGLVLSTPMNTALTSSLTASDPDGDALVWLVHSPPAHGTLALDTHGAGHMSYVPELNFVGNDSFSFSVTDGIVTSAPATVDIHVQAFNVAPSHMVPVQQSGPVNTPLVLSSANGNAIAVADPDAGNGVLQMTLSVSGIDGTLTLANPGGVLASLAGNGTREIMVTGTLAALNAALNGVGGALTFQPAQGIAGVATLSIVTNDQGNVGAGGAQSASDSVVMKIGMAPVMTLSPAVTTISVAANTQTDLHLQVGNSGMEELNYTYASSGSGWFKAYDARRGSVMSGFRSTTYTDPATAGSVAQYSAKDFEVPVKTRLKQLIAEGFVSSGQPLASTATAIQWSIFPDTGGMPAGNPYTGSNSAVWTYTATPSAAGVSTDAGTIGLNLALAAQSVELEPGKYWLVVNAQSSFANRWVWFASNQGAGLFKTIAIASGGAGFWASGTGFAGLSMQVSGMVECGASWLGSATPGTGVVQPAASAGVSVVVDTAHLAPGEYRAMVCFAGNVAAPSVIAVPVHLTVTP